MKIVFYKSSKFQMMVLSWVLFVLSFFLLMSMCSFDPYDPSWFYQSTDSFYISNWCGVLGSYTAALFFYLFGAAAWLLIPFLVLVGYLLYAKHALNGEWDRILSGLLLITAVATLNFGYKTECMTLVYPGGLIGRIFFNFVSFVFDTTLNLVFWHTMLFIAIIIFSRCMFVWPAHYIAQGLAYVFNKKTMASVFAFTKLVARIVAQGSRRTFHWAKGLLDGSILEKNQQTIVEFEFEKVASDIYRQVRDDSYWDFVKNPSQLEDQEVIASSQPTNIEELIQEPSITHSYKNSFLGQQHVMKKKLYSVPPVEIFKSNNVSILTKKEEEILQQRAETLEQKLACFGIAGKVIMIKPGPVITLFEYQPDIDAKVSKILALEDDLALALEATSVRIIAPIPGKSVVGFEVANKKRKTVFLSQVLRDRSFKKFEGHLPLALGHDTIGENVIVDLAAMPHLLIAGSTGSGKSVALNTMLVSLLCNKRPDQLKLILIDPKRLEFATYADMAHLLFPIVTEPKKTIPVLRWVVKTMEERYEKLAELGVRNVFDYQELAKQRPDLEAMPFIVVMIDELSDLMMTTGKEVEELIARIAQMARAAGIHMIIATQRPSVDVITGLIKVNFPSRISFRVTSKVDSRTILDEVGSEKLLGSGDMLFLNSSSRLVRIHGAYVTSQEIDMLVRYIREQQEPNYIDLEKEIPSKNELLHDKDDQLYTDVISYLKTIDEVSISLLQRRFRIGYNRSARIIEMLETEGLIMPSDGGKTRKVIH